MSRYQWSQEQRRVETALRDQEDRAALAGHSGNAEIQRDAQHKINRLRAYYERISEQTGIAADPERMAVSGFRPVKADKNLTFIENDAKIKAESGKPKVLKGLKNETLKVTAEVDTEVMKGVVPEGTTVHSVVVLAGDGTSTPIRDLRRLYAQYPQLGDAEKWMKKSGVVEGTYFRYEVHWYENGGQVPSNEIKIKRASTSK